MAFSLMHGCSHRLGGDTGSHQWFVEKPFEQICAPSVRMLNAVQRSPRAISATSVIGLLMRHLCGRQACVQPVRKRRAKSCR